MAGKLFRVALTAFQNDLDEFPDSELSKWLPFARGKTCFKKGIQEEKPNKETQKNNEGEPLRNKGNVSF